MRTAVIFSYIGLVVVLIGLIFPICLLIGGLTMIISFIVSNLQIAKAVDKFNEKS